MLGPPKKLIQYLRFKKRGPLKWLQYYILWGGGSPQMITIDYMGGEGSEKSQKMIT